MNNIKKCNEILTRLKFEMGIIDMVDDINNYEVINNLAKISNIKYEEYIYIEFERYLK